MNVTVAGREVRPARCARVVPVVLMVASINSSLSAQQGLHFGKKQYEPKPLPVFEATRGKLPSPIFDEDRTTSGATGRRGSWRFSTSTSRPKAADSSRNSSMPRSIRTSSCGTPAS